MVYLKEPEEGGETAFPAADNITYSESVSIFSYNTEVYSEPYRASKIDRFAKIVNNLMPVAIFEKRSSLEAWKGSEYASALWEIIVTALFEY